MSSLAYKRNKKHDGIEKDSNQTYKYKKKIPIFHLNQVFLNTYIIIIKN